MENKKVTIVSIISIIALVITIIGATYAYFVAQTGEGKSTDIKINANTVDTFTFEAGSALNLNLNQDNFASGAGNQTGTTFAKAMLTANNKTNTAKEHYYLYLNISENTFTYTQDENIPEILLTIKDASGNAITSISGLIYKTVTDGKGASISGFDITTKTDLITLFDNKEITTTSTKTEQWNITVTFVNYNADQTGNAGKSFAAKLIIQQDEYKIPTLAEYVLSQYTGTQGDNGIYYHNSSLANGAGDNSYRYAGANPNNYVCFGSNATTCPTDNLYRIIGVIDNKVKLIKYDYATSALLGTDGDYYGTITPNESYYKGSLTSINTYYWNNSTVTNTWSESLLNKTNLNNNFINNIGTIWSNKIATTTWKVGGNSYGMIVQNIPSATYKNEIISSFLNTTYDAKIGLMYVSDYGFGADPSAWTLQMELYYEATPINWVYMGVREWTIFSMFDLSDDTGNSNYAFTLTESGNANDGGRISYNYVNGYQCVRPTFFLNQSVTYVTGTGTQSDPIIIN